MSILNSLKGMVTPELISGVAGHLGESNDGISKAIGGIFPSLLGCMMGSKQEDHSMLSGLLSQAGNLGGGNLVGDLLGGLTGGNNNSGLGSIGSSLVSGLLGNKMGGAVELISKFAGIKSGSSSSLMSIGGSLLASFLGKKMIGEGLNFGSIMNMITGQKDEIMKAAPAGFASTLGLGNLFGDASAKVSDAVNTVSSSASNVSNTVSSAAASATGAITGGNDDNKGGGMKWLLPLLLLAGIGVAAWWFINKDKNAEVAAPTEQTTDATAGMPTSDTAVHTTDTARVAVDSNKGTETAPVRESVKVKLKDGVEINAFKGGVEDKLNAFLMDPAAKLTPADKSKDWFDFDNLNFDLGKSTITKESMVQVENLAAILKAYPTLKIKVGGYTDKKGDDAANLKLSQSRADAVFAALKAKGANAAQLVKAEGYGETLAVVAEMPAMQKEEQTEEQLLES